MPDTLAGAITSALQGTFESLLAAETGLMGVAQALFSGGIGATAMTLFAKRLS